MSGQSGQSGQSDSLCNAPSFVGRRIADIELGRVLGVGGFGRVLLGVNSKNQQVAVKIMDLAIIKENKLESYVDREIDMLGRIKHKHIIKLLSVERTDRYIYLIMELAPNGELFDKIVESRRFDENTARRYFQQIVSAVYYCHNIGIVHRDLKAENLLLGEHNELKVCDFGLSRYVQSTHGGDRPVMFMSLAGSIDYQAPEVINSNGYTGFSCDIWSLGVILFFMLTGYLPFAARSDSETQRRILSASYNRRDKHLSVAAAALIERILVVEVDQRDTLESIIADPWFIEDLDPKLFPKTQSPTVKSPRTRSTSPVAVGSPVLDQVTQLKKAFQGCDVTNAGYLTHDDVRDVFIKLHNGESVEDAEIENFWSLFSPDANGRISEEKFILGWLEHQKKLQMQVDLSRLVNIFHFDLETKLLKDLRTAFDSLDVSHTGLITVEDLLSVQPLALNKSEAQQLFDAMYEPICLKSPLTPTASPASRGVTFERFVLACTKADILRKHPLGPRLQLVSSLFEVCEHHCTSFINTGFTVAGLRDFILKKIVAGAKLDLKMQIRPSDGKDSITYGRCELEETIIEHSSIACSPVDPSSTTEENVKVVVRVIEIGLQLLPAAPGYTKVMAYRIGGKTEVFHQWFRMLRRLLRLEILTCVDDTRPVGEAELMQQYGGAILGGEGSIMQFTQNQV